MKNKTIALLGIALLLAASCQKETKNEKQTSSTKQTILTNDPPPPGTNPDFTVHFSELTHYVDGVLSTIASVNSNSLIVRSIYNRSYDANSVYHFTSTTNMNLWLVGKTFQADVSKKEHLMDSLEDTGSDGDTTTNDGIELAKRYNLNQLDPISNTKRVGSGGTTGWEHCHDVSVCGPSPGGNKYFAPFSWSRDIGWLKNQITETENYVSGWTVWCTQTKFKGRRFYTFCITYGRYIYAGTGWNDEFESVF